MVPVMNILEKTFVFENKQQKLFGILHEPDGPQKHTALIFLHGWGTYRIGPHLIFVEAARAFASAGFPCLRFDFRGRGESEGNVAETTLLDMLDDAKQAVREMLKRDGISQIILIGLCSGGEVAVGTAASDSNVNGVVLLSTPLLGRKAMTKDDVRHTANFAKSYWRKLFLPGTWRKIFSFRVNYRVIFKVLFGHLQQRRKDNPLKEAGLLEAFKNYKGACLFIYGEKDPEAFPSENAYRNVCAKNGKVVFKTIPEANHNFYSVAWKQELIRQVSEWLNTNFS
jgi:pimeloyl-ACP methyl ester carboxylesterase